MNSAKLSVRNITADFRDLLAEGFINQTDANSTRTDDRNNVPSWDFIPALSATFSITGMLTNSSVLVMILLHRQLHTPFIVYIINLLIINLLYVTLESPFIIVEALHTYWGLGEAVCTFFLYLAFTIEAVIFNSHAIITANQIWAITFPVSYKNYHTKRLAILVCFAVWVYAHVMTLPLVIQDALYFHRNSEVHGCEISLAPQYTLRVVIHFLVYDFPGVFVMMAYPFLWYAQRRRNKVRSPSVAPAETGATMNPVAKLDKSVTVKERSYAFVVLTFLTVNILVCWTLIQIYSGIRIFTDLNLGSFTFYFVANLLFQLAPVLDPLYFTIALKDLRTAFQKSFRKISAI